MTVSEEQKPARKPRAKKPPTQIAGVMGIDGHGGMGEAPIETPTEPVEFQQYVNWQKLINLPAFEMFVQEQSGHTSGYAAVEWVRARREALSDSVLYDQYAAWHKDKGLWLSENPVGALL